jgi:hypothetical protein
LKNAPFCPISASCSSFNPQNTQCIPAVKTFAFLELEQKCTFFKGLTFRMMIRSPSASISTVSPGFRSKRFRMLMGITIWDLVLSRVVVMSDTSQSFNSGKFYLNDYNILLATNH